MITLDVNEKGDGDQWSVDNGNQFVMCRPAKRQRMDIGYKGHEGNTESSDTKSSDIESSHVKSSDAKSSNARRSGIYSSNDNISDDKSVIRQKVKDNQLCFLVYFLSLNLIDLTFYDFI